MSKYAPQGHQDDGTFLCSHVPTCPFIYAEVADERKRAEKAEARVKDLEAIIENLMAEANYDAEQEALKQIYEKRIADLENIIEMRGSEMKA
jgi:hypothetical protein